MFATLQILKQMLVGLFFQNIFCWSLWLCSLSSSNHSILGQFKMESIIYSVTHLYLHRCVFEDRRNCHSKLLPFHSLGCHWPSSLVCAHAGRRPGDTGQIGQARPLDPWLLTACHVLVLGPIRV